MNILDITKKLSHILNGIDSEINNQSTGIVPDYRRAFQYVVETPGFHLDYISDSYNGENFIPVYVNSAGGQYNPVPDLEQGNLVVPIVFYFPVRFKEQMFALKDYLVKVFVGRELTYGSGEKAVSNISPEQYGEIVQGLDLMQFKEWVGNIYKRDIEITESWITMTLNLYLSTKASSFLYGNDAEITLTLNGVTDSQNNPYSIKPVFDNASIQSNSQPNSEQELGTSESESVPFSTTYASSFKVYYQDNSFYKYVVQAWANGNSQTMEFTLTITFGSITFSRICYLSSVNIILQKGQLISLTFAFAKKLQDEESDNDA